MAAPNRRAEREPGRRSLNVPTSSAPTTTHCAARWLAAFASQTPTNDGDTVNYHATDGPNVEIEGD